jgi:hypothetical protein
MTICGAVSKQRLLCLFQGHYLATGLHHTVLKFMADVEGFCLNLSAEVSIDLAGTVKLYPEVCQLTEDEEGSVLRWVTWGGGGGALLQLLKTRFRHTLSPTI